MGSTLATLVGSPQLSVAEEQSAPAEGLVLREEGEDGSLSGKTFYQTSTAKAVSFLSLFTGPFYTHSSVYFYLVETKYS